MSRFLTEAEVAEHLRCSVSKVKRLRQAGKLAYVPGRPVLIREEDLNEYIEGALRRNAPTEAHGPPASKSTCPVKAKEKEYDPAEMARKIWIRKRLGGIAKGKG